MWALVRRLRDTGVTIILTTHYIGEAEEMADRIGVIDQGRLILVEEKQQLMKKLGKRQLTLQLHRPLPEIPANLSDWGLVLNQEGHEIEYNFNASEAHKAVPALLKTLAEQGIEFSDLNTRQSSLEDIFVSLVRKRA
jgi:ABC-2 type transport system ATP-binding protein